MDWSDFKYFKEDEFKCRHCGLARMDHDFVDKLDTVRGIVQFPLRVSSGYRCPVHNKAVSTTGETGPHTTGMAADILLSGPKAREFLTIAVKFFPGIGISQKGPLMQRFIHVDDLESRLWSY